MDCTIHRLILIFLSIFSKLDYSIHIACLEECMYEKET
jgi:hypothetical protein